MWAITATFIAVGFVLWILFRKRTFSVLRQQGIQGPSPSLIFGNLLDIIKKTPLECHTEWIKKYGKVVGYYFGTKPIVLVSDIELLKKIQVSDFHKFANRPSNVSREPAKKKRVEGFSQHLIMLKDKRWKEVRSIITPSFTTSKMRQMTPIMNGAIDSLMINVGKTNGQAFDIYPMFQGLTMDVIGRTAFGIQTNVQNDPNDPFLRSSRVLFSQDLKNPFLILGACLREFDLLWAWLNKLGLLFKNKGTNPIKELVDSVKSVIALRRTDKQSRRPDLLQLMMDAEISESDMNKITSDDLTAKENDDDDADNNTRKKQAPSSASGKLTRQMTDADILDNSMLFFLAGYETTSTALAFTAHLLVHHPDVQDKVRKEVQQLKKEKGVMDYTSINELQYLDQVFNESLRMYPPIYLFVNREAGEDVQYGDIQLKKGMAVQVPVNSLHRNPDLWEDPDTFRPERFAPENRKHHPLAFQPFGGGPRNCVGMRFAQMEAKIALARLLSQYRLEKCPQTDEEKITLKISQATMNPAKGVYLKATPV